MASDVLLTTVTLATFPECYHLFLPSNNGFTSTVTLGKPFSPLPTLTKRKEKQTEL